MNSIHPNSIAAYWEGRTDQFGKRTQAIIGVLRNARGPLTDREVMTALRFSDPNAVRPRLTELVDAGLVIQVGDVRCPVTGKTVRLVKLATRETQRELQLGLHAAAAIIEQRKTA